MFNFSVLEKIQNLMREGSKKHLRKKNIELIFGNEGDEIKKTFDKFLEKLLRASK